MEYLQVNSKTTKAGDGLNVYSKYCPNVFAAKCEKKHDKGDVIIITTKYGKEIKNEVHNYLGQTKDGFYLYSVTRLDGYNTQERAKRKAERLGEYAENAENRSMDYYKKADLSEAATGIPLGQPILVGHYSESRHRKVIERADNAMRRSIEEDQKAEVYRRRSEYWASRSETINLSMPESLEYYKHKVEESKKHHQELKAHPEKREHSLSLTYANKAVKDAENNLKIAIKLWGTDEEIKAIYDNEKEQAEAKAFKNKSLENKIKKLGGFFAFNTEQFREGYAKIKQMGYVNEGEKVTHIKAGLYIPSKNVNAYLGK